MKRTTLTTILIHGLDVILNKLCNMKNTGTMNALKKNAVRKNIIRKGTTTKSTTAKRTTATKACCPK